jgi:hypothetical protein
LAAGGIFFFSKSSIEGKSDIGVSSIAQAFRF